MMKTIKYFCLAAVASVALFTGVETAQAQRRDDYWDNYWNWYDNSYRPYYNRRYYRNYYAPYRGYYQPYYGNYNPYPYYGGRYYNRGGYGIGIGPFQYYNWR